MVHINRTAGELRVDSDGRMVEWFKAAVLKTAEGRPSVGSNPTPSAIFFVPFLIYLKKSSLLLFCKTR